MILRNPTDNNISVQIRGSKYDLPARESISVSDEVGKYWLTLHAFLIIEEKKAIKEESDKSDKPKEKKEEKKEEEEEKISAPTAAIKTPIVPIKEIKNK